MNWFLLFLMFKVLALNWAKPIDSKENKTEHQTEKEAFENQINLTFTLIDEKSNFNKKLEHKIHSTEASQEAEDSSNYSKYITENSTEVLKETTTSSRYNNYDSLGPYLQHSFSTSTISTNPSTSDNSPNDANISLLNEDIDNNFTVTPTKTENHKNVEVKRAVQNNLDITTDLNASNADQVTQQSENNFEPITQSIFEMLPADLKYFHNHSQEITENVTDNAFNELVENDITQPAVSNPDAKELHNFETYLNDLIAASKPEEILQRSVNPVDIFNMSAKENTQTIRSSNIEKIPTKNNTITAEQEQEFKETTTIQQPDDSITQTEIMGDSSEKVATVSSMIQPITQNSDTNTALNEGIEDPKHFNEKITEQIPLVERSANMSPAVQDEPTTTEIDNENPHQGENLATEKLNLESINTENEAGTEETTTSSVLEIIRESQEEEEATSSVSIDFSTTHDNLIETTAASSEKPSHGNVNNLENPYSISMDSSKDFSGVTTHNFKDEQNKHVASMTAQTTPENFLISKEEEADNDKLLLLQNPEATTLKTENYTPETTEYLPAIEEDATSSITTQQPENTQFATTMVRDEINRTEREMLEPQETNKYSEIKENPREGKSYKNMENQISAKSLNSNENSTITNEITTEFYKTSPQIVQDTSTSHHSNMEETTADFEKLENNLIEKEKNPSATPLPTASITLSVKFTTVSQPDENKASTEKLQEKLQEAVKTLVKEMKKITATEAELMDQSEVTTLKTSPTEITMESVDSREPLTEHMATVNAAVDETSTVNYVPYKSDDMINEKLTDKFEKEPSDSVTVSQMKGQFEDPQEIKKNVTTFGTSLPAIKDIDNVEDITMTINEATTTIQNDVKENIAATTADDRVLDETTKEGETSTAEEYISKTTNAAILARVSLQKDVNNISLNKNIAPVTEVPTPNTDMSTTNNNTHIESTTIMQSTEPMEETITLTSSEASMQEYTDTTTFIPALDEMEDKVVMSQTTQTQPSAMEEKQQQGELTTEHDTQTASTATSGQTATTMKAEEQQTTEAKIFSTTEKEIDENKTDASTETVARSLPLSPPKLEYSQSEDGVEVFYGYSTVNHN